MCISFNHLLKIFTRDAIQFTESLNKNIQQVGGGEVIGIAAKSSCEGYNHIHMSLIGPDGMSDPSNLLSGRPITINYTQICDDYKLVYKVIL